MVREMRSGLPCRWTPVTDSPWVSSRPVCTYGSDTRVVGRVAGGAQCWSSCRTAAAQPPMTLPVPGATAQLRGQCGSPEPSSGGVGSPFEASPDDPCSRRRHVTRGVPHVVKWTRQRVAPNSRRGPSDMRRENITDGQTASPVAVESSATTMRRGTGRTQNQTQCPHQNRLAVVQRA